MDDMISKIVEMDRQARALTDKAKARQNDSESKIEQSRKELTEKRMNEAREKVDALRVQEEELSEQRWQDFSQKSDRIVKRLESSYKENGDKWVDEIVSRVTGS